MTVFLFPGQGADVPGMREEVERLRPDLFEWVVRAVGEDPFARIADGTRFAQPAILCTTLARWSAIAPAPWPEAVLGHSLGELGALVAAGSLSETEALRLVAVRGRLMDAAGRPGDGMLVLLGAPAEQVDALAADHELVLANDNAPGQVVLAGAREGLRGAAAAARRAGLRAGRLGVSGAFHSPAMEAARPEWEATLAAARFRAPTVRVISCSTGRTMDDPRRALAEALTSPVLFRTALENLATAGATHFVDVGPGEILAGLARRTLPAATVESAEATSHA